jgi:hypothetical protein
MTQETKIAHFEDEKTAYAAIAVLHLASGVRAFDSRNVWFNDGSRIWLEPTTTMLTPGTGFDLIKSVKS